MSRPDMPEVTVFSSGKGGVGKTTVVANLAVALARQARKVMVVDADFGLANLDVALGLSPERTLEHVFAGHCALSEITVSGPEGITLVPAGSGLQEMTALPPHVLAGLMGALTDLASGYDDLIIDSAAGISENVLGLFPQAHRLVVVVSPDPASLVDAYATIKLAQARGFSRRISVLVNGGADARESREIYARLRRVTHRFLGLRPDLLGPIPKDRAVELALRSQRLVLEAYPTSPASLAFGRLAHQFNPAVHSMVVVPETASVQ
ncbi:MAG: MinD/ParA family protein [Acidobacteriota bacterium]